MKSLVLTILIKPHAYQMAAPGMVLVQTVSALSQLVIGSIALFVRIRRLALRNFVCGIRKEDASLVVALLISHPAKIINVIGVLPSLVEMIMSAVFPQHVAHRNVVNVAQRNYAEQIIAFG